MEETDMADIRNSQNWSFETKQAGAAGSGNRGKSSSDLCISIFRV